VRRRRARARHRGIEEVGAAPREDTPYPSSTGRARLPCDAGAAPVTIAILAGPPLSPSRPALLSVIGCERDVGLPSVPRTRGHAGRVERHHHVCRARRGYHAAFAANRLQFTLDDCVGRLLIDTWVYWKPRNVVRDGVGIQNSPCRWTKMAQL